MKIATVYSKSILMAFSLIIIMFIPYLIVIFQSPEQSANFTKEDGIIENLSAIFYLSAAVISFFLYVNSKYRMVLFGPKTNRNIFFLMLGLLFFFCFGEEISWGQRIFSLTPTEWFQTNNLQGETNFHNLVFFESTDVNHVTKSSLQQLITAPAILILFWFSYCFVVPILIKKYSFLKSFVNKIKLPLVPIWIGSLFLVNQFVYEIFKFSNIADVHAMAEVKETNVAFLFLIACIGLYREYKTVSKTIS